MAHELVEMFFAPERLVVLDEAQAGSVLPKVAPPAGEHASPHGLLRRQQGQRVEQERFREGADAVIAAHRSCIAPLRHSVERVTGAGPQLGAGRCCRRGAAGGTRNATD